MLAGLLNRRCRPFYVWSAGGVDNFQRIQIIQPQIVLCQLVTFQSPNYCFARPLLTIHIIVGLVSSRLLF
nr:MAG TPA: hypothetical protein [Caudoviricetes sp.]